MIIVAGRKMGAGEGVRAALSVKIVRPTVRKRQINCWCNFQINRGLPYEQKTATAYQRR